MADAVGQSLSFAVGVAISPMPIIGMVLMLSAARARTTGPAFLVGWVAGIAVVGSVVLLAGGGADASAGGNPADWVSVLKLVVAALLVLVAIRQWRERPRPGEDPELPGWMERVDGFTARRAIGIGAALSGINPKNLLLVVAGAAAISGTGVPGGEQAGALMVFAAVASLGVAAPLVIYFALGDRSERLLAELRHWMARNNSAIMAVICLVIAAKLAGDALSALG